MFASPCFRLTSESLLCQGRITVGLHSNHFSGESTLLFINNSPTVTPGEPRAFFTLYVCAHAHTRGAYICCVST